MRWLIDALLVLLLLALAAGGAWLARTHARAESEVKRAASDVRRLELEIKYRAVTRETVLNEAGWPATVDPAWFADQPPRNPLLPGDRPWIELATEDQAMLTHPPVRMAVGNEASFWYNPHLGVVRARVPVMVSDAEAVRLYNRLNGTSLRSIFEVETPPPTLAGQAPGGSSPPAEATSGGPSKPAAGPGAARERGAVSRR
ncbi:MAG TPA: hypothetical protein VD963_05995 [Phycisphaerales bacterium]|nr:hypothetical protein [Phycisphaerales bacterium]